MTFLRLLCLVVASLSLGSCETLGGGSASKKPEREKLSSMPHNMPASWEGQAGMPGMMGGQY